MATRRVLIVDDEADVRKTLTDILRAMRYAETLEIEEVPDGREGLDAVVRQRPDLVLLDLQMPRMDGLALLKQIREVEPRLPVIVISGTRENKMSSEALRHGAVAYLPKPFDPRHVEMLVTMFLDSTRPRPPQPVPGV
ncbi:MAG TPA: response regulator [Methylomirabilota bacterium]|jgi:CheY-like chemotaxis protein